MSIPTHPGAINLGGGSGKLLAPLLVGAAPTTTLNTADPQRAAQYADAVRRAMVPMQRPTRQQRAVTEIENRPKRVPVIVLNKQGQKMVRFVEK
jgi:hypothetical protein